MKTSMTVEASGFRAYEARVANREDPYIELLAADDRSSWRIVLRVMLRDRFDARLPAERAACDQWLSSLERLPGDTWAVCDRRGDFVGLVVLT